jgi:hypothetical protein
MQITKKQSESEAECVVVFPRIGKRLPGIGQEGIIFQFKMDLMKLKMRFRNLYKFVYTKPI